MRQWHLRGQERNFREGVVNNVKLPEAVQRGTETCVLVWKLGAVGDFCQSSRQAHGREELGTDTAPHGVRGRGVGRREHGLIPPDT